MTRSRQLARCLLGILGATLISFGTPGISRGLDAASDARNQIRLYKAEIKKAGDEVTDREVRIFGADILIATNDAAIAEAKRANNVAAEFALQITHAALTAKKNDLVTEKKKWQSYKRECETALAEWEAYLRKIGG